jgi:valyl-tRNA synthetase
MLNSFPQPLPRCVALKTPDADAQIYLQPTGNESLVEQWILHKMNVAAKEINDHLSKRNFMMATTSAYNFWLYELCDVYIVGSIVAIFLVIK